MAYRIFALAVCVFWLVMTGLLIRSEVSPHSDAAWMKVPVDRVLNNFLAQGEESDLSVYKNKLKYGQVNFLPRKKPDTREVDLIFSGDMLIYTVPNKPQRVGFNGTMGLNEKKELKSVMLRVNIPERTPGTGPIQFLGSVNPDNDYFEYEVSQDQVVLQSAKGSIKEMLNSQEVKDLGVNPIAIASAGSTFQPAGVEARVDELKILNDTVPTHRITLKHASDLQTVMHISQTGKILRIDTPVGYTLLASGLEP